MDNRTIEEIRKNETKLINEIKVLEQQCKKQKEIFAEIIDYLNNNISYVGEKITIKPYTDLNDLMNILKEVSE